MGKLHKDMAMAMVQAMDDDQKSDQQIIKVSTGAWNHQKVHATNLNLSIVLGNTIKRDKLVKIHSMNCLSLPGYNLVMIRPRMCRNAFHQLRQH